jgi:hypothetical protein
VSTVVFPTYLVVPPLLVAFAVLAFLHWRSNPANHLLDIRFLMMTGAILLMFTQIIFAGSYPMVSRVCFPLAMVWLIVALLLLRRQMTQG